MVCRSAWQAAGIPAPVCDIDVPAVATANSVGAWNLALRGGLGNDSSYSAPVLEQADTSVKTAA